MRMLGLVLAFCVMGCTVSASCDKRGEAEERCKADCPGYGATFVRVKDNGGAGDNKDFECWCRRGAEMGGGSEPLRIW